MIKIFVTVNWSKDLKLTLEGATMNPDTLNVLCPLFWASCPDRVSKAPKGRAPRLRASAPIHTERVEATLDCFWDVGMWLTSSWMEEGVG